MKKFANMPIRKERRRQPRVHIAWPVVIQRKDRAAAGVATDISTRGARIRIDRPLFTEERLKVFIVAPDREPIEVKSAVSWSQVDFCQNDIFPCGVGIRFTEVSEPDRAFLTGWIESQLGVSTNQTSLTFRSPKLALTFRAEEGT